MMNKPRSLLVDHPCPHNIAVQCCPKERRCETCGWDPDVAKARQENFCRKHHIAYPLPEKEE